MLPRSQIGKKQLSYNKARYRLAVLRRTKLKEQYLARRRKVWRYSKALDKGTCPLKFPIMGQAYRQSYDVTKWIREYPSI